VYKIKVYLSLPVKDWNEVIVSKNDTIGKRYINFNNFASIEDSSLHEQIGNVIRTKDTTLLNVIGELEPSLVSSLNLAYLNVRNNYTGFDSPEFNTYLDGVNYIPSFKNNTYARISTATVISDHDQLFNIRIPKFGYNAVSGGGTLIVNITVSNYNVNHGTPGAPYGDVTVGYSVSWDGNTFSIIDSSSISNLGTLKDYIFISSPVKYGDAVLDTIDIPVFSKFGYETGLSINLEFNGGEYNNQLWTGFARGAVCTEEISYSFPNKINLLDIWSKTNNVVHLTDTTGIVGIKTRNAKADLHVDGSTFIKGGSGDFDNDGEIFTTDFDFILNYFGNPDSINTSERFARLDLDGNGEVNLTDVYIFLSIYPDFNLEDNLQDSLRLRARVLAGSNYGMVDDSTFAIMKDLLLYNIHTANPDTIPNVLGISEGNRVRLISNETNLWFDDEGVITNKDNLPVKIESNDPNLFDGTSNNLTIYNSNTADTNYVSLAFKTANGFNPNAVIVSTKNEDENGTTNSGWLQFWFREQYDIGLRKRVEFGTEWANNSTYFKIHDFCNEDAANYNNAHNVTLYNNTTGYLTHIPEGEFIERFELDSSEFDRVGNYISPKHGSDSVLIGLGVIENNGAPSRILDVNGDAMIRGYLDVQNIENIGNIKFNQVPDSMDVLGCLFSNEDGDLRYKDASGWKTLNDGSLGNDNLGDHNARDTVEMNGYNITNAGNVYIGQSTGTANLEVYNAEDKDIATFTRAITSTGTVGAGVGINFQRARSSMTAVSANDILGIIRGRGYDGSAFDNVTNIQMIAQSVSGGNIGGQIIFKTSNTTGTVTSRLWVNNDGTVGIGAQGESTLDVSGSFANKVTSINVNTTLDATYHTVLVDNGDGVSTNRITITLPQATSCDGREYLIKLMDESGAGNGFTIDGNSTERIYITESTSAETYNFDVEGGSITIQSFNGGWIVTNVSTTISW